jgi:hypothetical protein
VEVDSEICAKIKNMNEDPRKEFPWRKPNRKNPVKFTKQEDRFLRLISFQETIEELMPGIKHTILWADIRTLSKSEVNQDIIIEYIKGKQKEGRNQEELYLLLKDLIQKMTKLHSMTAKDSDRNYNVSSSPEDSKLRKEMIGVEVQAEETVNALLKDLKKKK